MTKSKTKGLKLGLSIAGLALALVGSTQAAPLLNEPFDQYANGTALTATGNWTAFSGAGTLPLTANNGTVTATNLTSGTSGEDDKSTFTSPAITTGILYYSALVTVPTGTTVTATTTDYFLAPYSTANGYAARIYVTQGSASGTVAFGLTTAAANTTTNPINKTTDLTLGTEYKLVLRYDVANKTATMGLFTLGSTVTTDSQLTITSGTAGTVTNVDSVAIRQGSATGAGFTTIIDGLQVGTTLADVSAINTGATPYFNAIPEPSSWALALVGVTGLVLLRVQRTRKA